MEITPLPNRPAPTDASGRASDQDAELRVVAQELEASFLAEMLKSAGLGQSRGEFGGGTGEDQFASFLVAEHAKALTAAGGIGLSEAIFEALKTRGEP